MGLIGATKEDLLMRRVIPLHVQMGNLCVRIWFSVVEKLVVKFLLASFIEYFFKGMFRQDGRILPINSTAVQILGSVIYLDDTHNSLDEVG